jgi:hypothetical protein
MSCEQVAGQYHNVKVGNKSVEKVKEFRYLGKTLADQNCIHEEMKSRLKSGNACYNSVQNLLPSSLLSKNLKTKIYRNLIRHVLYGCETWLLTLMKEHMVRMFENRVPIKIFGPKGDEVTESGGTA